MISLRKLLASLLLPAALCMSAGDAPKREFRSVWLTTFVNIDWPSAEAKGTTPEARQKAQQELLQYIESHAKRNFTGICFQVRSMADALYESSYEPASIYLSGERGVSQGWDPLAFAVEECHKRGLECYAWVNPYRFNRDHQERLTPQDKRALEEGMIISNGANGVRGEYEVFNPALPQTRERIANVVRELYTKYRIDGILFDDYFYPNRIPADETAEDWSDYQAANPGASKDGIRDWRRANINLLLKQLSDQIAAERPDMRFGVSPAGIAKKGAEARGLDVMPVSANDWQYDDIYSDPVAWLEEGSVDFISPQIYWFCSPELNGYSKHAPYPDVARWWSSIAQKYGRHFYGSIAPYRMADNQGKVRWNNATNWADLGQQIEINRESAAAGTIVYSAKFMDGPTMTGWGDYLSEHQFAGKSLIPIVAWKEHAPIDAPMAKRKSDKLVWYTGKDAPSGTDPIRRYTVYAVPQSVSVQEACAADGDGIDAKYLVRVVYGEDFEIPADMQKGYWFAVCTYDGYGYESDPAVVGYKGKR